LSDAVHSIAVAAFAVEDKVTAEGLSQDLALPLLLPGTGAETADYFAVLLVEGERLLLQQTGQAAPGPVVVDFGSAAMRHRRRGGANELLGRAVGVGKKAQLRVLDATAGLGRDAFVLADLGCEVHLRERNPIIAALLASGLQIAQASSDTWLRSVAVRMHLEAGDARGGNADADPAVDVIYLDPMFAPRSKSAAVKKEMALFQRLLSVDKAEQDAGELLDWALGQNVARVVVKRPLKGASLSSTCSPSHSIRGKSVRYDVYARRKLA